MRFNRGTIALLLIGIVVIVGAIILNNNQASAPGEPTATPAAPTGPLFEDLTDANRIVSVEIQNNLTAMRTVLTRGGDNVWAVEATNGHEFPVDQDGSNASVTSLIGLQYADSFESDQLAGFGLTQPGYTITLRTDDEGVYTMHLGDKNPGGNRYYVVTEVTPGTGVPATEESADVSTPEAELSTEAAEVEAAETEAAAEEADATAEAEATEEKTAEANSRMPASQARQEATEEATDEAAEEAEATEETAAEEAEVTEAAVEATEAAEAATPEATEAAATEESEATVAPTPTIEPLVNLSGSQTVRLVADDALDTLIGYVDAPPYIVPTDTPTPLPTANPYSEVEMTATAAVQQTATMDMLLSTLQARQTQTAAAVTPEASTPQP